MFVNAQQLTVLTYNVRLDLASDGINAWSNRKDFFAGQLRFYEPDIFGVQEALPNQVKDIAKALPQYEYVGVGRDGNNTGEASNIFFKKDRFKKLQSGTFWLSETPNKVSKGWDAAYNRICTYALLIDQFNQKQFWVFNTHLDNEGVVAREKGIELIVRKINELNNKHLPVILTGDLNSVPTDSVITFLNTKFINTRNASQQPPFGPEGSFNNFQYNQPATQLIDYIFISKNSPFNVNKYAIFSDAKKLHYPSDHFPVWVQLQYKK
ncbi:endonuclease/exonuclease/phosphatase family metal-dependent hydrolase [Hydrotalea sandarakina]|jgi:endonuclease/exonuclease/phosphatase family metal-dependent hydrolase|uniref:Endonuclease/exonuclease/phosphatase family metal-dependent hydrolase n=2 Tax=Hydrotalea sandarakina TaxID=1004304 RepID=A0A2W7SBS5_9BACT|nr:endonuclease/exonuclease/phosphatase family metal-dependent hydrolase [Hydrotalea sandarakina]